MFGACTPSACGAIGVISTHVSHRQVEERRELLIRYLRRGRYESYEDQPQYTAVRRVAQCLRLHSSTRMGVCFPAFVSGTAGAQGTHRIRDEARILLVLVRNHSAPCRRAGQDPRKPASDDCPSALARRAGTRSLDLSHSLFFWRPRHQHSCVASLYLLRHDDELPCE